MPKKGKGKRRNRQTFADFEDEEPLTTGASFEDGNGKPNKTKMERRPSYDDFEDDTDGKKNKKGKKKGRGGGFDDGFDDAFDDDFEDAPAPTKKEKKKKKKKKKNRGFDDFDDGFDDGFDDAPDPGKGKKSGFDDGFDDDFDDAPQDTGAKKKKKKKKKKKNRASDGFDDGFDDDFDDATKGRSPSPVRQNSLQSGKSTKSKRKNRRRNNFDDFEDEFDDAPLEPEPKKLSKKERRKNKKNTFSAGFEDDNVGLSRYEAQKADEEDFFDDPFAVEEKLTGKQLKAANKRAKAKATEAGFTAKGGGRDQRSKYQKRHALEQHAKNAAMKERRMEEAKKAALQIDEPSDVSDDEPEPSPPPVEKRPEPQKKLTKAQQKKAKKKAEYERKKAKKEEENKKEEEALKELGGDDELPADQPSPQADSSSQPSGKKSKAQLKRERQKAKREEENEKQRKLNAEREEKRNEERAKAEEKIRAEETTKREEEAAEEAKKEAQRLKKQEKRKRLREAKKKGGRGKGPKLGEEQQKMRDQMLAAQREKQQAAKLRRKQQEETKKAKKKEEQQAKAEAAEEEAQKQRDQEESEKQAERERVAQEEARQAAAEPEADEGDASEGWDDDTTEDEEDFVQVKRPEPAADAEDNWDDASDDEDGDDMWEDAASDERSPKAPPQEDFDFDDASSGEEDEDPVRSAPAQAPTKQLAEISMDESTNQGKTEEYKTDDTYEDTSSKKGKKGKKGKDKKGKKEKKNFDKKAARKNMRSPIGVIMGHVDTGKTKILDKIRNTKVQDGEAGGITQQIGATFLPMKLIESQARKVQTKDGNAMVKKYRMPGLLIIDTPGHESFANLRSRGSTLCDIAVLVVDINHGIEPQTRESIRMLRAAGAPFVVALNKIDVPYGWTPIPNASFRQTYNTQPKQTRDVFDKLVTDTIVQFAELGLNALLYDENTDPRDTISLVPTSAITGEGLPDLLMLITRLSQKYLLERLQFSQEEFSCTILEVKKLVGIGYTLDVILVNGVLKQGDTIVLGGLQGPIVTEVKALLEPKNERVELRIAEQTHAFNRVPEVRAAMSIRIQTSESVEHAIAGSSIFRLPPKYTERQRTEACNEAMGAYKDVKRKFKVEEKGVYVVASSLGSLEALLVFLREGPEAQRDTWKEVPISGWDIGDVSKKIVTKASVQLRYLKEHATILAFNVKISKDARELAERMGVRIFHREIIYNLFDDYEMYQKESLEERKRQGGKAVFPVQMQILSDHVIRARDPVILGCRIMRGTLRPNTPIVAMRFHEGRPAPFELGTVETIEKEGAACFVAKPPDEVAVKFNSGMVRPRPMYGRHFDAANALISKISRDSINELKDNYRDDMKADDWNLIKNELKGYFGIL